MFLVSSSYDIIISLGNIWFICNRKVKFVWLGSQSAWKQFAWVLPRSALESVVWKYLLIEKAVKSKLWQISLHFANRFVWCTLDWWYRLYLFRTALLGSHAVSQLQRPKSDPTLTVCVEFLMFSLCLHWLCLHVICFLPTSQNHAGWC